MSTYFITIFNMDTRALQPSQIYNLWFEYQNPDHNQDFDHSFVELRLTEHDKEDLEYMLSRTCTLSWAWSEQELLERINQLEDETATEIDSDDNATVSTAASSSSLQATKKQRKA